MSQERQGRRPVEPIDPIIAEKSIIGFVLMYPARIYQCQPVRPAHFSNGNLGEVWRILSAQVEQKGTGITPAFICDLMVRNGVANKATASLLLVECQDHARNAPDPESAGNTYTSQLIDFGYRREIKAASAELNQIAEEAVDTDEIRGQVQDRVYQIINYEVIGQQKPLAVELHEMIVGLDQETPITGVQPNGLMSGIEGLDILWNGAKPGQLVTIMARPSVGKTALGTQIAAYLAKLGKRGVIQSLEMYAIELAVRMACQISGIDSYNVERKIFKGDERAAFRQALMDVQMWTGDKDRRLHIADGRRIDGRVTKKSIADILAEWQHWRNRMQLDYLMVDYLQLVGGNIRRGENREREVASVSTLLKQAAQQFNVPVYAMCQARRPDKDHERRRPRMHEARESGQIEQDSDIMLIIHNYDRVAGDDETPTTRRPREKAEINLAKHRNGRTGIVKADFVTSCGRFETPLPDFHGGGSTYGSDRQPWETG